MVDLNYFEHIRHSFIKSYNYNINDLIEIHWYKMALREEVLITQQNCPTDQALNWNKINSVNALNQAKTGSLSVSEAEKMSDR